MIEIQAREGKGRAVVATRQIAKGQLIESASASRFPASDREAIRHTDVFPLSFVRPDEYMPGNEAPGYIVFGLASLCNHADRPNACVQWVEDEISLWAQLISLTGIAAGEEVTIRYTNIDEYRTDGWIQND